MNLRYFFEDNPKHYHQYRVQFDYEVEDEKVLDFVVNTLNHYYFKKLSNLKNKEIIKKALKNLISEYELLDWFGQCMSDEIHEHFQPEAQKQFDAEMEV